MNVSQMFRAVSEGRVVTAGGYAWSCPQCGAILGQSGCREARDRCALAHCLLHSAVAAPVPNGTTSPYSFHMAPHRPYVGSGAPGLRRKRRGSWQVGLQIPRGANRGHSGLTLERRDVAESVQAISRFASARIAQSDRSRFTNTLYGS